jgi:hypothetical protein
MRQGHGYWQRIKNFVLSPPSRRTSRMNEDLEYIGLKTNVTMVKVLLQWRLILVTITVCTGDGFDVKRRHDIRTT